MKKLALASVAFAGVTAFGAGDSFASGFVGFTNMTTFGSTTDSTVWNKVGDGDFAGSAGGTASFQGHSTLKNISVTAAFAGSTASTPSLFVYSQHCPAGANQVCAGFPDGTHVLGGHNGSGGMSMTFGQGLSKLGFTLSPIAGDWGASATFDGGGHDIGSVHLSGLAFCEGTSNITGCHVPAFIGAIDTTTSITSVIVTVTTGVVGARLVNGSGGGTSNFAVGPLLESVPGKIPEPATLSLLGVGLLGLGAIRRRRGTRDTVTRDPAGGSRWSPFGRWRVANGPPDAKSLLR